MDLHRRKEILQAIAFITICLQFLFISTVNAQQERRSTPGNKEKLLRFAKVRAETWEQDKTRADSLAELLQLPIQYQDHNRIVILQHLGYLDKPVYYATDNADAARIIAVDRVWTGEGELPPLTGEGVEINLWDGGAVLGTHREFLERDVSRIFMREIELLESNHSTHVAGTMAAAGVDEDAKGMAGKVSVTGWSFNNDIAEMAIAASEGIVISNHSYGPLCGWDYNSTIDYWYWHGNPDISDAEDYQFGLYDEVSADMDYIAWSAPNYLIVKSAGNDRNDAPGEQPIEHLVWDESWVTAAVEREQDGGEDGYDCLTPMAVPKNILTVGAVDDNRTIASFSAFGPTDDGRIKPDVLANGTDVYSSIASSDHSYDSMNGTSMSAASATGSISLLQQFQQELQPGEVRLSSTMKGLLIHTADECGPSLGPDYQHGWGILNVKEAADLMQLNYRNGGWNIFEGNIREEESVLIPVEVMSASSGIKITLCWTDPPGEASEPTLNPGDSKLINDLNLELAQQGTQESFYPWVLDPENPNAPATQGVNHVDNVEQLYLANPSIGEYQIRVSHTGSLHDDKQSYSLIITGISTPTDIIPPRYLQFNTGSSSVALRWISATPGLPTIYRIYRNDVVLAETTDTTYSDLEVLTDSAYEYYITAVYDWEGDELESLGTNRIIATPRTLKPLPVFIDFEEDHSDVLIKNSPVGWRWGDSDSLSSYYLRFEENTSHFIGTDSYTYGRISHVHDVAATLPLKLGGCNDVTLSFDYMLVSEMYGAIDELHIRYKLQEELEWHELIQLPKAHSWTHYSLSFPDELCKDGTQIGFYYDDLYNWGMGASLDNISIVGEVGRSVDLGITSMISPVSACTLSDAEPVNITIINAGEEEALPGDAFTLQMSISPGIQIEEQLVLNEALQSEEQLTFQFSTMADLSETGSYTFDFHLSSNLDNNMLNNSLNSIVENRGIPLVQILNSDHFFCEDEEPVLIQCSPEGGTLSGTGVAGLYFDPGVAGIGPHTLVYLYTDPYGCQGESSVVLEVAPMPEPLILNEDLLFCEDEGPELIQCSPMGGTLSGTGVSGLYFNPGEAGAGTHILTYSLADPNGCQGVTTAELEVVAQPKPVILNEDSQFCEDESGILVRCIPEGGTLSGPGVTGTYFYPVEAEIGNNPITYKVIYQGECIASTTMDFYVYENPVVDLGSDMQIELDDTIELIPSGNGISYFWFNATTGSSIWIIANDLGIGSHDIWVETYNQEECSAIDSMLLTIEGTSDLNIHGNTFKSFVYPNPFQTGFHLEIHEEEILESVSLLDLTGRVFSNHIPSTYPYFNIPNLPAGSYILKVKTRNNIFLIRLMKI